MDSSKLAFKFFFKDPAPTDVEAFVPGFHRWIQTKALRGHQLIDVADYKHVPDGPGTVLVSHEANFSIDSTNHQTGLFYVRKQPLEGDLAARIRKTLYATLLACRMIEEDSAFAGHLAFRTDNPLFRIHDRLHAPNSAQTFNAVKSSLESVLTSAYGGNVKLTHESNPETLFTIRIAAASNPSVSQLISKIS